MREQSHQHATERAAQRPEGEPAACRCAELRGPPGPSVLVVGCGNIGSQLVMRLPLIAVKRIVLIDADRVDRARNGKCCSIYACQEFDGRHKVNVLADQLRLRFPQCEVVGLPRMLNSVGLATLRDFAPAILVGAVDSRRARYELARTAITLDLPFIDLGISGSPDQVLARARTTWTSINGIDPLKIWSGQDWSLLESQKPCGRDRDDNGDDRRPVSSTISGTIAAALGLAQIRRLLLGDTADVGWETRINLDGASLARCKLPASGSSPLDPSCVVTKAPVTVQADTVAGIMHEAEAHLGAGVEVVLNRMVSASLVCNACGRREDSPGPLANRDCEQCGGCQHGVFPVAALSRESLGGLADAPLSCLGTDDDILFASSSDGAKRVWLEYRVKDSRSVR